MKQANKRQQQRKFVNTWWFSLSSLGKEAVLLLITSAPLWPASHGLSLIEIFLVWQWQHSSCRGSHWGRYAWSDSDNNVMTHLGGVSTSRVIPGLTTTTLLWHLVTVVSEVDRYSLPDSDNSVATHLAEIVTDRDIPGLTRTTLLWFILQGESPRKMFVVWK